MEKLKEHNITLQSARVVLLPIQVIEGRRRIKRVFRFASFTQMPSALCKARKPVISGGLSFWSFTRVLTLDKVRLIGGFTYKEGDNSEEYAILIEKGTC